MLVFKRNPILFVSRFVQVFFLAFMNCSLFFQLQEDPNDQRTFQDRNGSIFFFIIGMVMTNLMPVILTFPVERGVFLREYSSNMYGVIPYFLGRSLIEMPVLILFTLLLDAICYYIIGWNDANAGKFFIFLGITILTALSGNAIGLWVGSMFSDPKTANAVAPALLIPLMLFSGFFVNRETIPDWLGWIEWISPFKYGLEAALTNEYTDSPLGTSQLEQLDFDFSVGAACGILFGIGIFYRILALISLKFAARKL